MRIVGDLKMKNYALNGRQIIYPKDTSFNQQAPKYDKYPVEYGENLLKNALIRHKLYIS